MIDKYERQCWSCGSRDMEDLGDYVKCRKCGATWNEVNQLGGPVVEPGNVIVQVGEDLVKRRAKHPTGGVKRRAAQAQGRSK